MMLEMRKELLALGENMLQITFDEIVQGYGVPEEKLRDFYTMCKMSGRMEASIALEEMILKHQEKYGKEQKIKE